MHFKCRGGQGSVPARPCTGIHSKEAEGPTEGTIPPYDHYVVLTPADPMGTAKRLAQALGYPVAIVDINDLGANILGFSEKQPAMDWLAR